MLLSLKGIRCRKMRFTITVLSVALGCWSLVTLVSTGLGLRLMMMEEIGEAAGESVLEVYGPEHLGILKGGEDDRRSLDRETYEELLRLDGVVEVARILYLHDARLQLGPRSYRVQLKGMDLRNPGAFGLEAHRGRVEVDAQHQVLVGYRLYREMESEGLRLCGRPFRVVVGDRGKRIRLRCAGVVAERGTAADYALLMPVERVEDLMSGSYAPHRGSAGVEYDGFRISFSTLEALERARDRIGEMGLVVFSLGDILAVVEVLFAGFNILLATLGGLVLASAFLGIAGTMLASVSEQVPEVGIMKACGASFGDIRAIYLLEVSSISLCGAAIGLSMGWFTGHIVNTAAGAAGARVVHTPGWLVLAVVGLTLLLGAAAGLYPAWRAMRMDVLEAIRSD